MNKKHLTKKERMLKALRGSMSKWWKILYRHGIDQGINDCPLCALFNNDLSTHPCKGCSISLYTKVNFCSKTPYDRWSLHLKIFHRGLDLSIHCPECKELAKEEYNFLKNLYKSL